MKSAFIFALIASAAVAALASEDCVKLAAELQVRWIGGEKNACAQKTMRLPRRRLARRRRHKRCQSSIRIGRGLAAKGGG